MLNQEGGRINKQLEFWIAGLLLIVPFASVYAIDIDFNSMLSAMQDNAGAIIKLVVATAYVIGIWFIFSAIIGLKKMGNSSMQQQSGIGGPLLKFIIGLLLLYLPSAIDVSVGSIWGHTAIGSEASSYMEYKATSGDPYSGAKAGAIALIRVMGYISFVRGLIILSHSGDQGSQSGTFGKGIVHIIGGILAINIVGSVKVIANTLGFTIL